MHVDIFTALADPVRRSLLTELAADLRSSAPAEARGMRIDLDLDAPSTTQDVAVASAFLVTESLRPNPAVA